METIPNFWSWKTPIEAHKDVQVFRPIYGPSQSRGFGDGSPQHKWELGDDDTEIANFNELKAFWDVHFPGIAFEMVDPVLEETRAYEFDSNISYHYLDSGGVAWKVLIKEAYPYTVIT